jgi:hypothetical protein
VVLMVLGLDFGWFQATQSGAEWNPGENLMPGQAP